jgi:hypothetical protein
MWGYDTELDVSETAVNPEATIHLTRMLAKVDITMLGTVNNFKLHSAHLYNYTTKGSISPAVSTTSSTGYNELQWHVIDPSEPGKFKAFEPNLPTGAQSADHSYLSYALDETNTYSVTSSIGQIYAYEATQGSFDVRTNTCLVIGGYYNGSTTPTYHRVEFGKTDENGITNFYHILRNHHYNVSIQQVEAAGYSTQNDAYINRPANITVIITDWNNGGEGETVFTPQYSLFVDKSDIYFYLDKGQKSMTINTDYPGGWSLTDIPDTWLQVVSGSTGPANTPTTLTLKPNGTAVDAYFHIVAGNLKKRIYLWALNENELSLEINPSTLTFYKHPVTKEVIITPYGGRDSDPFLLSTAGLIGWDPSRDPTNTANWGTIFVDNGDTKTLYLQPSVNNSGSDIGGTVTVMLNGEQGKIVSRSVNITQLNRDMTFTTTGVNNPYSAAGGTNFSFYVNSPEAVWTLTPASNTFFTPSDGGEHAKGNNISYGFSLGSNASSFVTRDVVLEATSTNPEFYPSPAAKPTVTITQAAGATPSITINKGTNEYPHTFSGGTSKTLSFSTNAPWQIIETTNYTSVIGDVKRGTDPLATGMTYTTASAAPTTPATEQIVISPPTTSTGMARLIENVFTLQTATGALPEAQDAVTFKHVVPPVFNITPSPTDGTTIGTSQTNITLTATNVNIPWWGEATGFTNTKQSSNISTPQTTDQLTVTIPAQELNVASSWTSSSVEVQAGYDAQTGIAAHHETFTFPRPAFYINLANVPASISGYETSISMDVTTNVSSYTLDLEVDGSNPVENVGSLTSSGNGSKTIDVADAATARTINIVNSYTGATLTSFDQAASIVVMFAQLSNAPAQLQPNTDLPAGVTCPTGYHLELVDYTYLIGKTLYNTSGVVMTTGTNDFGIMVKDSYPQGWNVLVLSSGVNKVTLSNGTRSSTWGSAIANVTFPNLLGYATCVRDGHVFSL